MRKLGPFQQQVLDFLLTQKEGVSKYKVVQAVHTEYDGAKRTVFPLTASMNTYQVLKSLGKRGLVYRDVTKRWWAIKPLTLTNLREELQSFKGEGDIYQELASRHGATRQQLKSLAFPLLYGR